RVHKNLYEARIIRRFDNEAGRVMGMVKSVKGGGMLVPVNKKARHDFEIPHTGMNGAKDGDIALAEIMPGRGVRKKARIVEILGRRDDPKAISLISLSEAGLRSSFPERVIQETENM